MLNIPLAISSQAINYNLPGLTGKNIKLSGPILAGIYTGKITMWNDPAIAAANPGVNLPAHVIIPIHRHRRLGRYLHLQPVPGRLHPGLGEHADITAPPLSWPAVTGAIGANGNTGMLPPPPPTRTRVAYIGVSYANQAAKAGLGVAALKNALGAYVLPTSETMGAAASSVVTITPTDERISMIFSKGAECLPDRELRICDRQRQAAGCRHRAAVQTFLNWAVTTGNDAEIPEPGPLPAAAGRDRDPVQDPDRENPLKTLQPLGLQTGLRKSGPKISACPPGANREGFL